MKVSKALCMLDCFSEREPSLDLESFRHEGKVALRDILSDSNGVNWKEVIEKASELHAQEQELLERRRKTDRRKREKILTARRKHYDKTGTFSVNLFVQRQIEIRNDHMAASLLSKGSNCSTSDCQSRSSHDLAYENETQRDPESVDVQGVETKVNKNQQNLKESKDLVKKNQASRRHSCGAGQHDTTITKVKARNQEKSTHSKDTPRREKLPTGARQRNHQTSTSVTNMISYRENDKFYGNIAPKGFQDRISTGPYSRSNLSRLGRSVVNEEYNYGNPDSEASQRDKKTEDYLIRLTDIQGIGETYHSLISKEKALLDVEETKYDGNDYSKDLFLDDDSLQY